MINTAHPSVEQLAAFSLGKLPHPDAAKIADHLADCGDCRKVTDRLPDDAMVALIRSALSTHSSAGSVETVPVELTNHSRYRVLELLGTGGMGVVYKAEHRLMDRLVALKVINKKLTENPAAVERFKREVRVAAKLSHTNIVTAFDAEQAGELHFLVMEFVEGASLASLVAKHGPLPVPTACDCVRQVALGLQHAFEQGLVHRDIKPQNLLLTKTGEVKILDLGLARGFGHSDENSSLTQDGAIVGTPDYLAPEQAINSHAVDVRADIYSLGATLYFLLTGRAPFAGGSRMEKLLKCQLEEPVAVETLRPDVPAPVAEVVRKMMAKKPEDRFTTPAQVAGAMSDLAKPKADEPLPDWLRDVAQSESVQPTTPVPDWMDDVRQAEKPTPKQPSPPPRAEIPVDWLDDIRQIEESLRTRPTPTPPPPPVIAVPTQTPGYDPDTGRILDPVAFARWQKEESQRRQEQAQNQSSVAEAFLGAQRAIQEWVDADANKPLVTAGDMEAIRKSASVQELLRRYDGFGPVMQEKLWKRLDFLVNNRKQFSKALGA